MYDSPSEEYKNRFRDERLYECDSYKSCLNSCRIDCGKDVRFGGPMGAYIGSEYQYGGIMVVGINPNMGMGDKKWEDYESGIRCGFNGTTQNIQKM